MGDVYRAADTRLGRDVALKVLPPAFAADADRLARFQAEARALAVFDHPGIVTVYSVEQAEPSAPEEHGRTVHFLTMQLIEGQSLDRVLPPDGFPLQRFCEIGSALADALAAAHDKGIIHRDLKLANVMVTGDGAVKVLDFGIAKAVTAADTGGATMTSHGATGVGVVMGTPAYMAPEQIEGRAAQASSDIFSLGVVLYELSTGRAPFQGSSGPAIMSSILRDTPSRPSQFRTGLPEAADTLILECLAKDAARRPSARTIADGLRRLRESAQARRSSPLLRPRVTVAAVVCLSAAALLGWGAVSRSRRAVFVAESLPRIEALAGEFRYQAAFELASAVEREAAGSVPDALWESITSRVSVASEPAGATVTLRPVDSASTSTIALGGTPLARVRVPRGPFRWRVEHPGYVPADLVTEAASGSLRFDLRPEDGPDRDMIRIPGGDVRLWALGGVKAESSVTIGAYLIDRHEVTNRQFAGFVTANGYAREEFWRHPFTDGVRTLSLQEAMARFKDSTGRPGPATWKLGSYPDGQEDLPVTGISWYEAAAYAAFAGKELPTIYHWYQADTAGDLQLLPGLVLATTNHEGPGPRTATASGAVGAHGAIDMAGNVREWAANAGTGSTRLALGGAWSDPAYQYLFPEARSPFDRSEGNGVRGIKRLDTKTRATADAPLPAHPVVDRTKARPVSEAEYAIFTRFFEKRQTPLDARVESTDESPHWIKQRVSFAAGYGSERVTALLYLPRSARPPYQVVIQMAGAATFYRRSSATEKDIFGWAYAEYLIRGGRAVLIPIWKGSYERSDGFHPLQTDWPSYREHVVQWVSELRQSIDYLQSRDDIADEAIGYQGISNGAIWAPIFMALEPRIKTGIILLGGLLTISIHETPMPPEIDGFNYAPRVHAPVLMMNGRHDAIFPYETSQLPLLRVLGSKDADKRHLVFPGGHSSFGWTNQLIKEGLDWLDQRFGPPLGR